MWVIRLSKCLRHDTQWLVSLLCRIPQFQTVASESCCLIIMQVIYTSCRRSREKAFFTEIMQRWIRLLLNWSPARNIQEQGIFFKLINLFAFPSLFQTYLLSTNQPTIYMIFVTCTTLQHQEKLQTLTYICMLQSQADLQKW